MSELPHGRNVSCAAIAHADQPSANHHCGQLSSYPLKPTPPGICRAQRLPVWVDYRSDHCGQYRHAYAVFGPQPRASTLALLPSSLLSSSLLLFSLLPSSLLSSSLLLFSLLPSSLLPSSLLSSSLLLSYRSPGDASILLCGEVPSTLLTYYLLTYYLILCGKVPSTLACPSCRCIRCARDERPRLHPPDLTHPSHAARAITHQRAPLDVSRAHTHAYMHACMVQVREMMGIRDLTTCRNLFETFFRDFRKIDDLLSR